VIKTGKDECKFKEGLVIKVIKLSANP
jgi:hypothetical protein